MYTRKEIDNMRALKRRADFLQKRSDNTPENSFDKREARALCWALSEIVAVRGPVPVDSTNIGEAQ